ncbi:MAG: thiamine phosphate synthase, partial [Planctomycetaceae bacterium]
EQTPGISQIPGVLSGVAMRDTPGDVGTGVSTPSESERRSPYDVAAASLKRAEEALRSLEEFGKCLSAELGGRFESLRYRLYTLEKVILTTAGSQRRLAGRRLYLLLTRELCRQDPESVVRAAVTAGVDVIQVREKTLSDRELLAWALRVRAIIEEPGVARPDERDGREDVSAASSHALRSSGRATPLQSPIPDPPSPPLLIVNDRPDIAVLCRADGVHVGQDELSAADVRRIVGPEMLVGVSTHTLAQAQQAVLDGADYLGVGPVFASRTKEFEEYAGLDFVRDVASEISLPWFAIGGIRPDNAVEAISAGAERIAVSGAICRAEDPANATAALRTVVDGQP